MERFALTGAWQEIVDGSFDNVVVQSSQDCMIYIGEGPTDFGFILGNGQDGRAMVLSGFTDQKIFAKAINGQRGDVYVAGW